ncbi:CRISPR-associated protein Cas5 [Mesorhizobium sp. 128a]
MPNFSAQIFLVPPPSAAIGLIHKAK